MVVSFGALSKHAAIAIAIASIRTYTYAPWIVYYTMEKLEERTGDFLLSLSEKEREGLTSFHRDDVEEDEEDDAMHSSAHLRVYSYRVIP